MRATVFAEILQRAVSRVPGAVGGAFAAWDGETVDAVSDRNASEWAILTAHYGVILAHIQRALHTFHFGETETVVLSHEQIDVLIQVVGDGYYALLAVAHPGSMACALRELADASSALWREMH